jgi:hypothetical protein
VNGDLQALKLMLMNGRAKNFRRHPEALAAQRRASKDRHKRLRSLPSFETRARARSSG